MPARAPRRPRRTGAGWCASTPPCSSRRVSRSCAPSTSPAQRTARSSRVWTSSRAGARHVADVCGDGGRGVGGGNTAMDAARTALRLGAREVRVVYRRTRAEMPAIAEEIDEALEEGVADRGAAHPGRLRRRDGTARLVCRRMALGEPDEIGRPTTGRRRGRGRSRRGAVRPAAARPGAGSRPLAAPTGRQADCRACRSAAPAPVFAAGDLLGGEGTVAAAIGSGRSAASTSTTL